MFNRVVGYSGSNVTGYDNCSSLLWAQPDPIVHIIIRHLKDDLDAANFKISCKRFHEMYKQVKKADMMKFQYKLNTNRIDADSVEFFIQSFGKSFDSLSEQIQNRLLLSSPYRTEPVWKIRNLDFPPQIDNEVFKNFTQKFKNRVQVIKIDIKSLGYESLCSEVKTELKKRLAVLDSRNRNGEFQYVIEQIFNKIANLSE